MFEELPDNVKHWGAVGSGHGREVATPPNKLVFW
jgi:hypothetical protein